MQQVAAEDRRRLVFLDGIRGWAALAVVFYHLLPTFVLTASEQKALRWLMPAADGTLAVYVFFVVSGFSLSIAFVRSRSTKTIASLAVRRYPRLAIPVLSASLLGFAMMRVGLNDAPEFAALTGHTNWPVAAYQFHETFLGVLRFGLWDVFFNYDLMRSYNPVLWTMSVEIAGSAIVFAILATVGKRTIRWIVYVALWSALLMFDSSYSAFIAGVILAEVYDSATIHRLQSSKRTLWLSFTMITVVFYVAVARRDLYATVTPISILGTVLVASVLISRTFIAAMEHSVSRQLGIISFPLYLTHIVVVCIVGARLGIWLTQHDCNGYALAAIEGLIVVPLCVAAAYFFLPIESLSVRAGRKLARLCAVDSIGDRPIPQSDPHP